MAYPTNFAPFCTDPIAGLQPLLTTQTTQKHAIGSIVDFQDATYGSGEAIYLPGLASTAAGDVVTYDLNAGVTKRAVHLDQGPVAVALSANVAGQYGWYMISGAAIVNTGASTITANTPIYLTSTAGAVSNTVVSTDKIDGLTPKAANSGGFTVCQLDRPALNGNG